MAVITKKERPDEALRAQVKASIVITSEPKHVVIYGPKLAKKERTEIEYYVYTNRPELFGGKGTGLKYLGDIEVLPTITKWMRDSLGDWMVGKGVRKEDKITQIMDFFPYLGVPHEYRGSGVGGKVLDFVLDDLKKHGVKWVCVRTFDGEMKTLLQSRGFEASEPHFCNDWLKKVE